MGAVGWRIAGGLLLFAWVIPATSIPRWYAEEGASISLMALEAMGHSAGFFSGWVSVGVARASAWVFGYIRVTTCTT
jgi:hypothetical protein